MIDRLILTTGEKQSPTWRRLLKHLQGRLVALRSQNDGPHDVAKTADLRGCIAEVKAMIDFENDEPVLTPARQRVRE